MQQQIVPASIPYVEQGFGGQFSKHNKIINGFYYDINNTLLYPIISRTNQFNIFINVSQGFAKQFNYVENPDVFYNQAINGPYHACLLTEGCGPLLTEDGSYLLAF